MPAHSLVLFCLVATVCSFHQTVGGKSMWYRCTQLARTAGTPPSEVEAPRGSKVGAPDSVAPQLGPLVRVAVLHGHDIRKKRGNRKGKVLFSFPRLVSPMPGSGTWGTLAQLGTDKPALYSGWQKSSYPSH
ncbi:hypothetical protein H310_14886 [Aphanomyces invadans]|uniref:Secreted protein n=1 Tax=Aphanomyces invadans TaxID=157072 RepID=A0A024T9J2_9STRA|nr:hypothetical protein H310_14886 [Aphanomyces invadans]ETV90286.1 hypothetical protein H310_14886 [Aphanomyces invadans]|eukprot:XP_008881071.1 hypothetical protein H310_14886 [Aphanomyces invadans]